MTEKNSNKRPELDLIDALLAANKKKERSAELSRDQTRSRKAGVQQRESEGASQSWAWAFLFVTGLLLLGWGVWGLRRGFMARPEASPVQEVPEPVNLVTPQSNAVAPQPATTPKQWGAPRPAVTHLAVPPPEAPRSEPVSSNEDRARVDDPDPGFVSSGPPLPIGLGGPPGAAAPPGTSMTPAVAPPQRGPVPVPPEASESLMDPAPEGAQIGVQE